MNHIEFKLIFLTHTLQTPMRQENKYQLSITFLPHYSIHNIILLHVSLKLFCKLRGVTIK